MERERAEQLAKEEMIKFGLPPNIIWTDVIQFGGLTMFNPFLNMKFHAIYLSWPYIRDNDETYLFETLRHEIAHALVSPYGDPHGQVWKDKCLEIHGWAGEDMTGMVYKKPKEVLSLHSEVDFAFRDVQFALFKVDVMKDMKRRAYGESGK